MYEVIKLNDNSWRIEDEIVRAFLFVGTEKALLVDSGLTKGDMRTTIEGITDLPVILVNTHGDDDHTGCNDQFDKIFIHPSEYAFYAKSAEINEKVFPIWENEVLDIGGRRFEVILIPGHTPGSIALLEKNERILVAGDSVSATPIFLFGEGRSMHSFICSMAKLEGMTSLFDEIYASHGPHLQTPERIGQLKKGAEELLKGNVEGMDPPMEIPAKMYDYNGAMFFY